MKPPKRSPFLHSRQADLLQVYRHLYPDSPFLPSNSSSAMDRHKALSIVQLWINRSACPFAVEATALLVQSVILDDHMQQVAASSLNRPTASLRSALEQMGGGAELGVRLNYSLALTRFVNSVVDSHQTGGFAQSIAAIAARIGLPLWFVEIRHAVTHEELPSIAVCRQAAGSALAWLHRHFWIPQLFQGPQALHLGTPQANAIDVDVAGGESSASASASNLQASEGQERARRKERAKALADLCATLKSYRTLAKQVSRDRSLANTSKDDFRRLYKQFAMFVSKMRTLEPGFGAQLIDSAAGTKKGRDEDADVRTTAVLDPDQVDECTKSALADLVNQLLQPGWLVPLSVAKRVRGKASGDQVVLPVEVASIWAPLLGYLRDTYGGVFGQILAEELVDVVVRELPSEDDIGMRDELQPTSDDMDDPSYEGWKNTAYASASYRKTAEAWLRYLVSSVPPSSHASANSAATRSPMLLISESDLAKICLRFRSPACIALLEYVCERSGQLKHRLAPLLAVLKVSAFVHQVELELGTQMEARTDIETDASGFEAHLDIMEQRRRKMEHVQWSHASHTLESSADPVQVKANISAGAGASDGGSVAEGQSASRLPPGWSLAPQDWKPTPFGCLNGQIPDLILQI